MSETKNSSPGARRPGRTEALTVRDRAELTAHAGDYAAARTVEFIELCGNAHTQRAYARAISEFVRWCSARAVTLAEVEPFHVARYMRELGEPPAGSARKTGLAPLSRKQHRAALSMWLNYLVINHVVATNPVSPVKGPRHSQTTGSTPVLDVEQVRRLFDAIDGDTLADVRDRALIAIMLFAWARVGAVTRMRVRNFRGAGTHSAMFELHEKGGKYHVVPAHHVAAAHVEAYLNVGGLRNQPDAPLWQNIVGRSKKLSGKAITQRGVLSIVKRRCVLAGLPSDICNHSFRATAITLHQLNGGDLESARQLANHSSIKTTQLYNRAGDKKKRAEVERVQF
jgi:site-specific recombinase XerD